jgi:hypothetical protein
MVLVVAALPVPALAACTMVGITVTCDGATSGSDGFGDGSQTGLTVTVKQGASVTGTVNDGLFIGDDNTVNNAGTVEGQGGNGITAGTNLIVNNAATGVITGPASGITATSATITNYGSISGTCCAFGIGLFTGGTVINHGTISAPNGGQAIVAGTNINVTNTGNILGGVVGVLSGGTGTIVNSGTISANDPTGVGVFINNAGAVTNTGIINAPGTIGAGVVIHGLANVVNQGTIAGGDTGVQIAGFAPSSLTNSGTISGTVYAIDALGTSGATLTFLPGSRIIGPIALGFNTTVNIATGGDVGSLLNFNSCGCGGLAGATIVFSNGTIGVVSGDRIATLDPTAFAYADRTLLDFTSALSSVLNGRLGVGAAGSATAFAAGPSAVTAQANAAFAGIPALAYADEGHIANAAAYDKASGIGVWSRGFAAARHQDADGVLLAAGTTSYGGMIGLDKMVAADLRLGAFVGAGEARLGVDRDSQTVKTDTLFAGVYGRKTFNTNAWGTPFLDVMLTAGRTGNHSDRLVASNSAPSGYETATASYDGWFVSPEIAYGIVMPLGGAYTLTPSARLRYLAGHFDGYGETGSSQTLSVSGRTTHDLEQRAELALTYHGPGFRTTWTAGVLAAERIGGGTVDTTLIGTPLAFATPGDDTVFGVYGGFGVEFQITGATVAYLATQGTLTSDSARMGLIQGGFRVTF